MAMYWCNGPCGKLVDGDWCVGSEDPRPGNGLEIVCEDCICDLEEEKEYRPGPFAFSKEQLAQIKKSEEASHEGVH